MLLCVCVCDIAYVYAWFCVCAQVVCTWCVYVHRCVWLEVPWVSSSTVLHIVFEMETLTEPGIHWLAGLCFSIQYALRICLSPPLSSLPFSILPCLSHPWIYNTFLSKTQPLLSINVLLWIHKIQSQIYWFTIVLVAPEFSELLFPDLRSLEMRKSFQKNSKVPCT